jgi:hypothetical protein
MNRVILLIFALLLFLTMPVWAETRRVPTDYTTVQGAIDASSDGDVVIVEPGTYEGNFNFKGQDIVLTSVDPNDPEIVASTILLATQQGRAVRTGLGSAVTLERGETPDAVLTGFTITGGAGTVNPDFGQEILWGGGVYCINSSPTIKGNVITDNHGAFNITSQGEISSACYGGGIGCFNSSPIIINNIIKNNEAFAGAGILIYVGNAEIINNLIYRNSAYVGGGVILIGGNLINNTIVGNDASFTMEGTGGNLYIIGESGLQSQIVNNIICKARSGGGVYWEGEFDLSDFKFNNVWANEPGNYIQMDPQTGQTLLDGSIDQTGENGNISGDPLFVNPQGDDYHLQVDSPCISAGDPEFDLGQVITDIDGEPRVYALIIDMGADEYVGYVKPVADAGSDQYVDLGGLVTLDGSGSFVFDPCTVLIYEWDQLVGPAVELTNPCSMYPTFVPAFEGEYQFELVVSDGDGFSQPDVVTVIVSSISPVANAGPDQSMSVIPPVVTLDGSGSYDPTGRAFSYRWRQIDGPVVQLSNENAVKPTFVPAEFGIYVFELLLNNGRNSSKPDIVGIVIGNSAPVSDAGLPRYAAQDPVLLNGIGSYDPDIYGNLIYQWQQISGPMVNITDGNTPTPIIDGFTQTGEVQRCKFELTVSDGDLVGESDTVEVIIVPDFGNNYLIQANPPFDSDKPTIVAFGGGDCVNGSGMSFLQPSVWYDKVNFLTVHSYGPPYKQYGDALIVHLSNVAPNYNQLIQTIGFSTGVMPAIDVAVHINKTYADARYAINHVTFLDAACKDYTDDINEFLASGVDSEACWIDNYIAKLGKFYSGTLNIRFPAPPAEHSKPLAWYQQSADPLYWPDGDIYNDGVTAGFYISVAGPGKNLGLAPDSDKYYFEWDPDTDSLKFSDESLYPYRIPKAAELIGPEDGEVVSTDGAAFSCETSESAVSYQLLFGDTPDRLDYVVSETTNPPQQVITEFPFETTYWTVRIVDEYGATIYADPRHIKAENVTVPSN